MFIPLYAAVFAASQTTVYLADSGDAEGLRLVGLLFFLAGPLVYFAVYSFYRNPDARHLYEEDTDTTYTNLAMNDQFLESKKGTTDSELDGTNSEHLFGLE